MRSQERSADTAAPQDEPDDRDLRALDESTGDLTIAARYGSNLEAEALIQGDGFKDAEAEDDVASEPVLSGGGY